ncbi:hypothetical protein LY90DRAFT_630109 [Neocallimastix californiae]|uniref:Uncharacterized protein n=1 Tax=Neocallimastix californiae TaxID=1754190 RepID=A0A1Y2AQZ4_9FUNG|nr:hypothetical protein LY90DRAFT_630109 [Neocallimastix californiae]|eukprot:ORY24906.1 hypothetical protein LY90DRAFT_630109 [Neocallimastix californiae]
MSSDNEKIDEHYEKEKNTYWAFLDVQKMKKIFAIKDPILGSISAIGLIIGWFINILYYNQYISIISNKIEKKYNQQHVISALKEEIEMNRYQDDETKSLETIVTKKWIYIQFFNYLHGIRKFIFINKTCFIGDEVNELISKIDYLSEKVLNKSAKLVKATTLKYLIYNSALINDMDKAILTDNDSTNGNSNDFKLMNIKNQAVQYHLAALNSLKKLMNSLRVVEDPSEFDNVMSTNDELAKLLSMGESTYKNYIIHSNYSKESLELYILFLKNSMEKYIQKLEDNKIIKELGNYDNNKQANYNNNSEKYEMDGIENKRLISMKNNLLHKCQKPLIEVLTVMQITSFLSIVIGIICLIIVNNSFTNIIPNVDVLVYGLQSPLVMCKINCGLRFITVVAAAGIHIDNITNYDPGVVVNVDYLEQEYLSYMYHFHSLESYGYETIHPISNGVIDEMKEVNYYEIMHKIFYCYSTKSFFNNRSDEYTNQVTKICEKFNVDDEGVKKNAKKKKTSSIKKAKYLYILFCIIIPLFLLYPFLTILIFKPEFESLTSLLVNSKLEKDLKNGKYGGRPSSEIEIFDSLYNNNNCVRHPFSMWKCDLRVFDELYTEELANSPIDYMMVEYLSNLSDYIDEEHEKKYNLTDQEEIKEMITNILANPRVQLLKKLSEDILGFIDQMNDIGITYLVQKLKSYKSNTLIFHISSSLIIYISFYLFVSRPIKKQLRAIDSLVNITFSIPSSMYKTSPRLKKYDKFIYYN